MYGFPTQSLLHRSVSAVVARSLKCRTAGAAVTMAGGDFEDCNKVAQYYL